MPDPILTALFPNSLKNELKHDLASLTTQAVAAMGTTCTELVPCNRLYCPSCHVRRLRHLCGAVLLRRERFMYIRTTDIYEFDSEPSAADMRRFQRGARHVGLQLVGWLMVPCLLDNAAPGAAVETGLAYGYVGVWASEWQLSEREHDILTRTKRPNRVRGRRPDETTYIPLSGPFRKHSCAGDIVRSIGELPGSYVPVLLWQAYNAYSSNEPITKWPSFRGRVVF